MNKDINVDNFVMCSDNVESIDDHRAYSCQCGSVHFNLLKSGNVECSSCGEKGLFIYGIPCPKCTSIDTSTRAVGGHSMIPEQDHELCNECGHEWGHR